MDAKLAVQFSLMGRRKKSAFKTTVLYSVVIEATRMSGSRATDNEMDSTIQETLKHAKDKLDYRSHLKTSEST